MAINRRSFLAATAVSAVAFPYISRPALAAPAVLRFGHPHPESDSWQTAGLWFADKVKERTNGAIAVQMFPNGVLGSDSAMINAVRGGTLDIMLTGNPFFTGLVPKLNVLDLPFLFKDRAHVAAVLDGAIGDSLRADLGKFGLKVLATWETGWRHVTNSRRPVNTPADLKGLKIRTTPNLAHIKAFQLLGAVPTPMAFTELFTALETRSVDGQENPTTLILNSKFFEVQKHLSLTQHAFTTAPVIMNKAKFEALSKEHAAIVEATAKEATKLQRQMNAEKEQSSLEALKKAGMQAVENPDRAAFAAIVAETVRKDFEATIDPDLAKQIVALAG